MEISINGTPVSRLPAMFVMAISPNGNDAIYQMKIPNMLRDKQNMLDGMKMFVTKLEREINNDMEKA